MKIIYFSTAILPSKTANSLQIINMCNAFVNNGHKVVIIAPKRKHDRKISGIDVYKFYEIKNELIIKFIYYPNILGGSFIYAILSLLYLIRNKPVLIYGRFLLGCAIGTLVDSKIIYEAHNESWNESFYSKYLLQIINKNSSRSKLVVISNALKNAFLDLKMFKQSRIQVLHDGANKISSNNKYKIKLEGKGSDRLNICYVGHLYPGKGMEIISKIAPLLEAHNFHVVGGFEEDIMYWKNKIHCNNVYFYGHIKHSMVQEYINLMDICLLPLQKNIQTFGYSENKTANIAKYTSPLKLFEYMAASKLIIASDLPVLREVLNDDNSIIVESDSGDKWIKAILKSENLTLRQELEEKAYSDFISNYTWSKRAKRALLDLDM